MASCLWSGGPGPLPPPPVGSASPICSGENPVFSAGQRGEGAARPVAANGPVQGAKEGKVRPAAVGEDTVPDGADALRAALAP